MTAFSIHPPSLVISPLSYRTHHPFLRRIQPASLTNPRPCLRGSSCVTRLGFRPEPETVEGIRELFGRAEALVYTIADAAVSSSDAVADTTASAPAKQSNDWLSGITSSLETILKVLKDGLSSLHVPYAYGFAIILLTVLVKAATFPLTKKQVESAIAMRSLQPQIKAIQQRYAGNQERIQLETARLYKLAGINPLAGCLPTLATIPVWIGLYRALSNVANEGLLTEGFFWIPSLAGPTTVAARQNGSGISWLFPFIDGHPPLGWSDTLAYLVLPVLLVVAQYISVQIMQSSQSDDPNVRSSQAITKFLPLMIGYFALSVPSGLSLYWLTNNILSTAQQVWLQKLGGAKNPVELSINDILKDSESKAEKSALDTSFTAEKAKQEEKLTPEGLHPGERFKKLKEQEARKRKQREEEKSKSEDAAVLANQTETEGDNGNSSLVERDGVGGAEFVDGNDRVGSAPKSHDSSKYGVVVNGSPSSQDLKKDEIGTIEKESVEVYAPTTTTKSEHSGEETEGGWKGIASERETS